MNRVIVESPFAGDVEANIRYARACLKDCLLRGEAPFASHLLYTQVLDDENPNERRRGLSAAFAWMAGADLVVVYEDKGVSEGMKAGMAMAKAYSIKIERRKLGPGWDEE